ncbi:MAG TPA: PIG-L family deacetylase [Myxococcales bacterium]|jgi:LmbE family N-acetylglucosaminyl deacetylase
MTTALVLLAMTLSPSSNPPQLDAAHLRRAIERLDDGPRVLYIAAHPDDENTRLLAWLVQEKKARAAYLSITRGDGGQNLIGKEQGPALGLIRTQELLAARRIDGAEQFFTRARDFGFSKSPEEALRIWGKDRILEDVVQVIRTFRPDVIVTRFSPQPMETHGHHTASAQLALEAFTKAADPSYAKELGLAPWRVRRIVWNSFTNDPKKAPVDAVKLEANPYDALLGLSIGELAGDSRTMHKSQGFGAMRSVSPAPEFFTLLAGEPMQQSILDGVAEPQVSPAVRNALQAFRPEAPQAAIPALLEAYAQSPRPEIAEAIVQCAGLVLLAVSESKTAVPGTPLPVTLTALQRNPAGWSLESVQLGASKLPGPGALSALWQEKTSLNELPPLGATDAAFLREPPKDGFYDIAPDGKDIADRIRPEPPPLLVADFTLRASGHAIVVRRPIVFREVDPVLGDRTRAIELAPPATIDAEAPILLFPDAAPRTLQATVRASAGPVSGTASVVAPQGFSVEPKELPFKLDASGQTELSFRVKPAPGALEGELKLAIRVAGNTYDRGRRTVEYGHIPPQVWHPRALVRAVRFDLKPGGTRTVGYVEGAGDEVAQVLAQLGYRVTLLDEAALRGDLSRFDALVLGVRAFNVHPGLGALKPRLFDYVQKGGVLLEQYNTKNFLSKLPEPLGPYPFSVSSKRVTDETAQVSLTEDAVLRGPNPIGARDFEGWVQERGLYFPDKWDAQYATPLSMHDPGEEPLRGGLLVARYGKGRFVYTGLAFFRQLPAGVPGALRLFANLLARDAEAL